MRVILNLNLYVKKFVRHSLFFFVFLHTKNYHTNIHVHVIEKLLQVALLIKARKMKKIWCPYPEIHTYRRGNHDLANQYTVNARFVVPSLTVYVQQIFCLLCSTTSHYKTTRLLQTVNIELIIKCPYKIWQLAKIQFDDIKWFYYNSYKKSLKIPKRQRSNQKP